MLSYRFNLWKIVQTELERAHKHGYFLNEKSGFFFFISFLRQMSYREIAYRRVCHRNIKSFHGAT